MQGHDSHTQPLPRVVRVMGWGDRKAICQACRFVVQEGAVMRCARCRAGAAYMYCAVAAGSAGLCGMAARYFEPRAKRPKR